MNKTNDLIIENKKVAELCAATETRQIKCLKCDTVYSFPAAKDAYLAHLYLSHRLVIADVEDIALLEDYLEYWIEEFKTHDLAEYCTTMFLDQLPDGTPAHNERYYLLCDILPKDFELRKRLQQKRLECALQRHQYELTDRSFSKECLYCRDVITGLRANYFEHLFTKHFLVVGKPENLVYVDELITILENNLQEFICLFCEKRFKDRATLKEHMRKKGHKRINPNNQKYDKFFLINYNSEQSKPRASAKAQMANARFRQQRPQRRQRIASDTLTATSTEIDTESVEFDRHFARIDDDENDSNWSDWAGDDDEEQSQRLKCLYCCEESPNFVEFKQHMLDVHNFDFVSAIAKLNFYQRIKVVNFVRRQMCLLHCINCDLRFDDAELLEQHMQEEAHLGIGSQQQWDKPEYFFPYIENDGLLCVLDDSNNDNDESLEDLNDSTVCIISEDPIVQINKDAERLSLENFEL